MNFKLKFTLLFFILSTFSFAQKGVRIAYIDFDEIIEKIGDYKDAAKNLESKAENWNKEIEVKKWN